MEIITIIITLALLVLAPPIILATIGITIWKKQKDMAKRLWLLSALYLLIAWGFCLTLT